LDLFSPHLPAPPGFTPLTLPHTTHTHLPTFLYTLHCTLSHTLHLEWFLTRMPTHILYCTYLPTLTFTHPLFSLHPFPPLTTTPPHTLTRSPTLPLSLFHWVCTWGLPLHPACTSFPTPLHTCTHTHPLFSSPPHTTLHYHCHTSATAAHTSHTSPALPTCLTTLLTCTTPAPPTHSYRHCLTLWVSPPAPGLVLFSLHCTSSQPPTFPIPQFDPGALGVTLPPSPAHPAHPPCRFTPPPHWVEPLTPHRFTHLSHCTPPHHTRSTLHTTPCLGSSVPDFGDPHSPWVISPGTTPPHHPVHTASVRCTLDFLHRSRGGFTLHTCLGSLHILLCLTAHFHTLHCLSLLLPGSVLSCLSASLCLPLHPLLALSLRLRTLSLSAPTTSPPHSPASSSAISLWHSPNTALPHTLTTSPALHSLTTLCPTTTCTCLLPHLPHICTPATPPSHTSPLTLMPLHSSSPSPHASRLHTGTACPPLTFPLLHTAPASTFTAHHATCCTAS